MLQEMTLLGKQRLQCYFAVNDKLIAFAETFPNSNLVIPLIFPERKQLLIFRAWNPFTTHFDRWKSLTPAKTIPLLEGMIKAVLVDWNLVKTDDNQQHWLTNTKL